MTTSTNVSSSSSGAGVVGLLGITFVVLKLVGVIDWSWWLVTLPFWGGFALVGIIALAVLVVVVLLDRRDNRRLRKPR